jgi:hypothetical protein
VASPALCIAEPLERAPSFLGVKPGEGGASFAVFSRNANAIDVCVFGSLCDTEIARWRLSGRNGDVFHGFVPGVEVGARYGLRAHGEYNRCAGKAFDPSKLLIDGGVRTPLGFAAPYLDTDHPLLRSTVTGEELEDRRIPASDDFFQGT